LVKAEHKTEEYKKINPNQTLPSLILANGDIITQSTAIIEYLEEMYPTNRLLPTDPVQKAKVRAIMALISSDIQPIQNLRVLNYVGETRMDWGKHFITTGFEALEKMLSETSQLYCFGNEITLADAYLVPQVYNAHRYFKIKQVPCRHVSISDYYSYI
jgi:maleylacetoacetate isomerase